MSALKSIGLLLHTYVLYVICCSGEYHYTYETIKASVHCNGEPIELVSKLQTKAADLCKIAIKKVIINLLIKQSLNLLS